MYDADVESYEVLRELTICGVSSMLRRVKGLDCCRKVSTKLVEGASQRGLGRAICMDCSETGTSNAQRTFKAVQTILYGEDESECRICVGLNTLGAACREASSYSSASDPDIGRLSSAYRHCKHHQNPNIATGQDNPPKQLLAGLLLIQDRGRFYYSEPVR